MKVDPQVGGVLTGRLMNEVVVGQNLRYLFSRDYLLFSQVGWKFWLEQYMFWILKIPCQLQFVQVLKCISGVWLVFYEHFNLRQLAKIEATFRHKRSKLAMIRIHQRVKLESKCLMFPCFLLHFYFPQLYSNNFLYNIYICIYVLNSLLVSNGLLSIAFTRRLALATTAACDSGAMRSPSMRKRLSASGQRRYKGMETLRNVFLLVWMGLEGFWFVMFVLVGFKIYYLFLFFGS